MEEIKFSELNLSKNLMKAITDMGFEEATPIQTLSIPYIMEGRDIIGQAQTGTGKTAAFGLPALEKVNVSSKKTQVLILCPTRELAIQVAEELNKLAKYMRRLNILPVYGGQPIDRQIIGLKKGAQIVVGTPGRVMDHMRRHTLVIDDLKMVILDEADEMLNMGFREDIESILMDVKNDDHQTLLFSATMPRPIMQLAKKFQNNPEIIKVVHKELTVPNIEQYFIEVSEKSKTEALSRLIDMHNPKLSLIFCNTKKRVDDLTMQLQSRGYQVDSLHGDLKQSQRDRVMKRFKHGIVDCLVATDVAARGLDIDDVEMVFNYDVPQDDEYYVHRIGRTGRAGRTGKAISLVSGKSIYRMREIGRYAKTKIKRIPIPSANDVEQSKAFNVLQEAKEVLMEGNVDRQLALIEEYIDGNTSPIAIAAALLKMITGDTKVEEIEPARTYNFEKTGGAPGMSRFFLNIGRNQNLTPGDVIKSVSNETGMSGKLIGAINIYSKFTFFEVPIKHAGDVLEALDGKTIRGNIINIEPAKQRNGK